MRFFIHRRFSRPAASHTMVQRIPVQQSARAAFGAACRSLPAPLAAIPAAAARGSEDSGRSRGEKIDFDLPMDIRVFPANREKPRHVAIISAGGAQGGAFAAQVLLNAKIEDYKVSLHVRDEAAFRNNSAVRCGDLSLDIARHPRALVAGGPLEIDPENNLIIDPTVAIGLPGTISGIPAASSVAYTQNGVPGHQREKSEKSLDIHTLVSLVTSTRKPGEGITVAPGGILFADENDACIDLLHVIFHNQGFFRLENVPDIHAAQYEKIALNCALNVTATLFGIALGPLRQMAREDPRCEKLIAGLTAEVCAVALAQGIFIKPADRVVADIHAAMGRFPQHPTSMRAAFDAGAATEITVLNAAISALGRQWGIATPLNDLVAQRLTWMERLRDEDGVPERFHQRHRDLVARCTEEILDAAAALA